MLEKIKERQDIVITLTGTHGECDLEECQEDFISRIPLECFNSTVVKPLQEVLMFFKKYPTYCDSFYFWQDITKAEGLTEEEGHNFYDKFYELINNLVDLGINFPSFEEDLLYNIKLKEIFIEDILQRPCSWDPCIE